MHWSTLQKPQNELENSFHIYDTNLFILKHLEVKMYDILSLVCHNHTGSKMKWLYEKKKYKTIVINTCTSTHLFSYKKIVYVQKYSNVCKFDTFL